MADPKLSAKRESTSGHVPDGLLALLRGINKQLERAELSKGRARSTSSGRDIRLKRELDSD